MGTNFYFYDQNENEKIHIGKRSAAGIYCWDCQVSLMKQNHTVLDNCPKCGEQYDTVENMTNSAAGRELGFNKEKPSKKTGIYSCSAFTWAIPYYIYSDKMKKFKPTKLICPIEDEYGRQFSFHDFEAVLEECPIQSFDMVGRDFS